MFMFEDKREKTDWFKKENGQQIYNQEFDEQKKGETKTK